MTTLCKRNITFSHKKSINREKEEPDTLLSCTRNMIVPFMKTHFQRQIKVLQFLTHGRIQKCLE